MAKKKNHNLNTMKGTKLLLLFLALTFVVVPLFTLAFYLYWLSVRPF